MKILFINFRNLVKKLLFYIIKFQNKFLLLNFYFLKYNHLSYTYIKYNILGSKFYLNLLNKYIH